MSDFSDDVYAVLLSACDAVEKGIRFVGEKGNEVWDCAKTNGEIRSCKTRIEDLYAELGRLSREPEGAETTARRARLTSEIDELEAKIQRLRQTATEAGRAAQCPNPSCNKNCDPDDAFCRGCGQRL